MKKILLTGATGFVGRQVARSLVERGCDLRLIVRDGRNNHLENFLTHSEVIFTRDVFSETSEWWSKHCEGIDTVVHLAWYAEPGKYLQSLKNLDCLLGSLNLAKGAAQAGVKRFVGIGTCFEYDLAQGVLSIDTPLRPLTLYADAKAALYLSLSHWLPMQSVEFAWCRLFYLYGEGEDPRRLVPYLRAQLEKQEDAELTSGLQVRDFLDVRKAGEMIATVALGKQAGPVNICSGAPVTVRQFAEQIADEYGRRDLLRFGARPDNLVDPPRVLGVLNIEQQNTLA